VSSTGALADDGSFSWAISSDGRFVAFHSQATNLVPNDTNNNMDVLLRDRQTHTTTRVSVASDGTEANGLSNFPAISGDGLLVTFNSNAGNLVPGDTNEEDDEFLLDRTTGLVTRVSVTNLGRQIFGFSNGVWIGGGGRFIVFVSNGGNVVAGDTNGTYDVFVRDRFG
jgi:hypothetical protein